MPIKRKATEAKKPNRAPNMPGLSPPPKRQRVSRACDQCRAAREKCDGIQPQCDPCVSQNRPCTYHVSPKKRGVQTGYIRALEVALAWLFERVPGAEDALATLLVHEGGRAQLLLTGRAGEGSDRLHRRWRRSRIQKGIDRILSGEETSLQGPDETPPPEAEAYSNVEAELRCKTVAPDIPVDTHITPHSAENLETHAWPSSPRHDYVQSQHRRLCPPRTGHESCKGGSRFPGLPPNHCRLLDIYFSYTHSWFPIIDRQALWSTYYSYLAHENEEGAGEGPVAAHAELWSTLALASFQESASSSREMSNMEEAGDLGPHDIYRIARGLVPSEDGPFELAHVRALLLLSLVNLGNDKASAAWMLIGMATRILLDFGTQSMEEPSSGPLPFDRQSAFIACFILDTAISVRCNKAPHLRLEDAADVVPMAEDGLDEWQPWTPCAGFGPTASRGAPSRSLSTFNKLYAIMRAVNAAWSSSSQALDMRTSLSLSRLEQTLGRQLGSSTPPTVPGDDSKTAPQPYIVHAVYQWARGVLGGQTGEALQLVVGVIKQYSAMFSVYATPPLFTLCLSPSRAKSSRELGLAGNSLDESEIFGRLQEELKQVWARENNERTTSTPSMIMEATHDVGTGQAQAQPAESAIPPTHAAPWDKFDGPDISAGAALSLKSLYATPDNTTYLTTAYTQPKPAMLMNSIDNSAIVDDSALNAPPLPQHQHRPLQARPNFNDPPLDYDAILDDLGSIDYADRVERDRQFMANLGFAPGCDLADILTREFGAM